MASCHDCVHVEVCKDFMSSLIEGLELDKSDVELINKELNQDDADKGACDHFLDRARVAALPCLPGDKVFYFDTDERIYVQTVESLIYGLTKTGFVINSEVDFISDLLGERFFLSYEEAKMALKEREENAN